MRSSGVVVAVETSTRRPSVAACRVDSAPLVERLEGERAHASDLLPRLDALLTRLGAGPSDIVRVVVGLGPGSLTGLRVGAAHALGVARAADADLVGVPSFEAAAAAVELGRTVLVLADARGGCFDAALYLSGAAAPKVLRAPFSLDAGGAQELVRRFAADVASGGAERGAEPGVVLCDAATRERFEIERHFADVRELDPQADRLLELGRSRPPSAGAPEPLYLRDFAVRAPRRR